MAVNHLLNNACLFSSSSSVQLFQLYNMILLLIWNLSDHLRSNPSSLLNFLSIDAIHRLFNWMFASIGSASEIIDY